MCVYLHMCLQNLDSTEINGTCTVEFKGALIFLQAFCCFRDLCLHVSISYASGIFFLAVFVFSCRKLHAVLGIHLLNRISFLILTYLICVLLQLSVKQEGIRFKIDIALHLSGEWDDMFSFFQLLLPCYTDTSKLRGADS